MNEKKPSYLAAAARYGLFVGLILVLFGVVNRMIGVSYNSGVNSISYLLILGGIILATISFRDKELNGFISYSGALGFGTLITVFAGIIAAIYTYLLMAYIDPGILDEIITQTEANLMEQGMSDEQIEQGMKWSRMFLNPVFSALSALIGYVFIGFILSLITSTFLKKAPAEDAV